MTWRNIRRDSGFVQALEVVAGVVASLILFGLLVYGIGLLLNQYIQPTNSTQKKDLVQALGFIVAGTAGAIGIFFTWRNLRQERDKQITERFTRAIDQLGAEDVHGNEKLEVRIGAMYALEQIAKESGNLRTPVIEVLSAYVRMNSSTWPKTMMHQEEAFRPWDALLHRLPDIQTALDVLKRAGDSDRIDLTLTDLRHGDLSDSEFENAKFDEARLEGAILKPARRGKLNFRKASFKGAHLEGAILRNVDLKDADFQRAHLHGTTLTHCNLEGVKGLTYGQIHEAIGDKETTVLPEGLEPPAWWNEKMFDEHEELFNKQKSRPSGECPLEISTCKFTLCLTLRKAGWLFRTMNVDRLVFRRDQSWLSIHEEPRVFDLQKIAADLERATQGESFLPEPEYRYLIEVPKAPDAILSWFKELSEESDYVKVEELEESEKIPVGRDKGVAQLKVTAGHIPEENFPISSPSHSVPIFHSRDGRPFFLASGNENRIIILNAEGRTRIIVLESPENEFESFFSEAKEVLRDCEVKSLRDKTVN